MTQFENNVQRDPTTLLQDIMRLVARSPELDKVAPAILEEAIAVMQAAAGFFMVFEAPFKLFHRGTGINEKMIPDEERLSDEVKNLSEDVHISNNLPELLRDTYKGWLLVPIMHRKKTAGVFSLLFENDIELTDENSNLLLSLIDGLTIVTSSEKTAAHHEKLTTNQNEFVRIVSHDLRSPLTSIKGFASMLETTLDDEKELHFVSKILNGVTQMTYLVDNIQDAGRYDPETGFYEMERVPSDLIDMVNKIVKTHLVPAEKGDLSLEVDIADDIPIVSIDENMIERSIINLVDNAIKYTPNGGKIKIGLRKDGHDLLITISDNGFGISEENIRQLFNRHFRIRRREHTRVKGSGLGLFIVRSVARHHNGDAFVESVEGEGSTFGIRIPLSGANLPGGSDDD